MKTELILSAVGFAAAFLWFGMMIGISNANYSELQKCQKQNNVYECVMIAIPADKRGIYEGVIK